MRKLWAVAFALNACVAIPAAHAQVTANLPVTCRPDGSSCSSATAVVNPDGTTLTVAGRTTMATGQVSVGTSATLVVAARAGRQKIIVTLGAANDCYFGNIGVLTTTGFRVKGVDGASLTIDTAAAVYGICAVATTVSYLETF